MFFRRMMIIIVSLVLLAVGFQFLRSFGVINLIENENAEFELSDPVSPQIPDGGGFEKYLLIYDVNEENSINTTRQIVDVFDYLKKDYDRMVPDKNIENISDYDCVFLVFERLDYLDDIDLYLNYVEDGGRLVFLIRPIGDETFRKIAKFLGIRSYKKDLAEKSGLKVLSDIMFGAQGFSTASDKFLNSSMDLELDSSCKVDIETSDGCPLLWSRNFGKGTFIVLNGTMLNDRINRGLVASIISLAKEDFIYPVMNIKMVHIDDFPAPVPEGVDEKIYDEFNRNIQQFYREVWWSDMVRISKKYDLKYTGFVIEKYNNDTIPPFEKPGSEDIKNLIFFGRELLGLGGEIGLHGYNHQSLALDGYIKQDLGYNSWKSVDDMKQSITELMRFIHTVFGRYKFRAYVPPSNILSPEGRKAVIEAAPDIKIIASQYFQNREGDIYAQEFEVAEDGIIEFPRITAGYIKDDELMWNIYNGVNMFGVFSHFIHPDDILDAERNYGLSWSELFKDFESVLSEVNNQYRWLRGFTVSTASREMVKYLECRPVIQYGDDSINIYTENFRPDIYCVMRTEKEIKEHKNCEYEEIGKNVYLITIKDKFCNLSLD